MPYFQTTKNNTVKESIGETFLEAFHKDPNLILIGENLLDNERKPTLELLKEKFPDRVINHIPLVEELLGYIGLGMSIGGLTPIVQIDHSGLIPLIADSIYRIAIRKFRFGTASSPNVIFRIGYGGGGGGDLSAPLINMLFGIPNIWIALPSDPSFIKPLYTQAFNASQPVLLIEDKRLYDIRGQEEKIPTLFFPASSVASGSDMTVVGWGWMAQEALAAKSHLKSDGIDIEVVMLHTLCPFDIETIAASISKTGKGLIIEEGMERGSLGPHLYQQIKKELPSCALTLISGKNVIPPKPPLYKNLFFPSQKEIIEECKRLAGRRNQP